VWSRSPIIKHTLHESIKRTFRIIHQITNFLKITAMKKISPFFLSSFLMILFIFGCKKEMTVIRPETNSTVSNYENIENRIKAFKELMNSNLDVSSSGSSNQTLFPDLTLVLGIGNYQWRYGQFDSTDYWFRAWDQGKCGPYYDPNIEADAIDQLLYKIHHPLSQPPAGYRYYFIDIVTLSNNGFGYYPDDYPDENYPGEWEPYRLFSVSGPGEEPPEQPCINPDDMNYYLYDGLVYIINDLKPGGKTFADCFMSWDVGTGMYTWNYVHKIDSIQYGVRLQTIDPAKTP